MWNFNFLLFWEKKSEYPSIGFDFSWNQIYRESNDYFSSIYSHYGMYFKVDNSFIFVEFFTSNSKSRA
jgi:hypothetical protein